MAAAPDDPETGEVADGATSETRTASEQSTTAHMSDDTTDELRARLSEKDDRIADLETQVEQLQAERDDVARAYAEALAAGDTVLDTDDYVEKFEVAELREKYENTEAATLAETEPTVQSGGSEPEEEATLSESEQAEVADLRETIEALEGESSRLAEIQREQHADRIAELTGEDADAILATED